MILLQVSDSIAKAESLEYQEPWKILLALALLGFCIGLGIYGFSNKQKR